MLLGALRPIPPDYPTAVVLAAAPPEARRTLHSCLTRSFPSRIHRIYLIFKHTLTKRQTPLVFGLSIIQIPGKAKSFAPSQQWGHPCLSGRAATSALGICLFLLGGQIPDACWHRSEYPSLSCFYKLNFLSGL